MEDIYYNPWANFYFDQNDQQPIPDTLPIEETLPTELEALKLACTEHDESENMNSTQDLWEILEETEIVVLSGQVNIYNNNQNMRLLLDSKQQNTSQNLLNKEEMLLTTKKKHRQKKYLYNNLIKRKLYQIRKLLLLRVTDLRLDKILYILGDIKFLLYPYLPKSFKNLDKEFLKLYYSKTKSSQRKLVKQVIDKIDIYFD
jgi:hypothetical protein